MNLKRPSRREWFALAGGFCGSAIVRASGGPAQAAAWPALPDVNSHVDIPAQASPHVRGERTVRVYLTYPGGASRNVDKDTGLMLTLHNWGGTNASGTADPKFLAERYNVVAIAVDYFQSGDVDQSIPYDFGYLQALDALRALYWVFDGLHRLDVPFNHRRIYAAGGSGGGNVALMANKLAPRTFACIVDCSGMCKLDDDIAFGLEGGSTLDARYSRDPASPNFLTPDARALRFVGYPAHLAAMKALGNSCKIIVSHGSTDDVCPVEHAREMAANMHVAGLDVEAHFIEPDDLDGDVFKDTGHSVGDRTRIVDHVAGRYLSASGTDSVRHESSCDFDLRDEVRYATANGVYAISYEHGYPLGRFDKRSMGI